MSYLPPKPRKSFKEKVTSLESKGLNIEDPASAEKILQQVNYYHLRGYCIDLLDSQTDQFYSGANFERIVERYYPDDRLRAALCPFLAEIELKLRVACSYAISSAFGSVGYLENSNFHSPQFHRSIMRQIYNAIERSEEPFIDWHDKQFGGKFPIWVVVELVSLGILSKLYRNMHVAQ